MSKSKKIVVFFCFVLSCILFGVSAVVNQSYFNTIVNENVWIYEGKQVVSLLLMVIVGYLFIKLIQSELSEIWVYLFALPTGIVLWTIVSFILLLFGLPFNLFVVSLGIAFCLLILLFLRMRKKKRFVKDDHRGTFFVILLSLCLLVSTGFVFVFLSYDSYYYFINYGNSLTIFQSYEKMVGNNSFTLTNIGQLLPLLNTYTSFWGLDQSFQIQVLLEINVVFMFIYGLFEHCSKKLSKRQTYLCTVVFTVLLLTSTSFIIINAWILSNMYCMAFMVMVFFLGELSVSKKSVDVQVLLALSLLALALLRKDGLVFAVFLLICIATKNTFSSMQLAFMILPGIVFQLVWLFYVRVVLSAKVDTASATSIVNDSNVFFVLLIVGATFFYLWIRTFFKKMLKWEKTFILFGLVGIMGAVFCIYPLRCIDNFDVVIKNIFILPSSWGMSGYVFLGLITISLIRFRKFTDYYGLVWIGYGIITFLSYTMAKTFWVNWDDSYNRVLLQIVPIFVFAMADNIVDILCNGTDKVKMELNK